MALIKQQPPHTVPLLIYTSSKEVMAHRQRLNQPRFAAASAAHSLFVLNRDEYRYLWFVCSSGDWLGPALPQHIQLPSTWVQIASLDRTCSSVLPPIF